MLDFHERLSIHRDAADNVAVNEYIGRMFYLDHVKSCAYWIVTKEDKDRSYFTLSEEKANVANMLEDRGITVLISFEGQGEVHLWRKFRETRCSFIHPSISGGMYAKVTP